MMANRRYAAFLRGVMPTNAKMPDLRNAVEAAGFTDVKTVLSSGNVVFTAAAASEAALEKKAEAAMMRTLGRSFATIIRSLDALRAMVDADPYAAFPLAPDAKRIVTFLRATSDATLSLPVEFDGARILCREDREVFSAYVPSPRGASFMVLIEKTFGKDVTTRTWDTVKKVLGDHPGGVSATKPAARERAAKPAAAKPVAAKAAAAKPAAAKPATVNSRATKPRTAKPRRAARSRATS
jgi:uncharacterized protein (DUF1697 family)